MYGHYIAVFVTIVVSRINGTTENETLDILHIMCKDIPVVQFRDAISAVDFAVKVVNNKSDILKDHDVRVYSRMVSQVGIYCS